MGQEWRGTGMWAALLYSFDISCLLSMKESFFLASTRQHPIIIPLYMQHACHTLGRSRLLMVLASPEFTLSKIQSADITPSHTRVSGDFYLLQRDGQMAYSKMASNRMTLYCSVTCYPFNLFCPLFLRSLSPHSFSISILNNFTL